MYLSTLSSSYYGCFVYGTVSVDSYNPGMEEDEREREREREYFGEDELERDWGKGSGHSSLGVIWKIYLLKKRLSPTFLDVAILTIKVLKLVLKLIMFFFRSVIFEIKPLMVKSKGFSLDFIVGRHEVFLLRNYGWSYLLPPLIDLHSYAVLRLIARLLSTRLDAKLNQLLLLLFNFVFEQCYSSLLDKNTSDTTWA